MSSLPPIEIHSVFQIGVDGAGIGFHEGVLWVRQRMGLLANQPELNTPNDENKIGVFDTRIQRLQTTHRQARQVLFLASTSTRKLLSTKGMRPV
jgi:hypothetical protein